MAMLARRGMDNESFHTSPLWGITMPEHFSGSFVTARTLSREPNFHGQAQSWHVIGRNGVMVRETPSHHSAVVETLPFATICTVAEKTGVTLTLTSPVAGYVDVADESGYLLLTKGGADTGAKWRYRIVCRDGAFVREGMELTSRYLFNLPCQSIVEVFERRINEAGLPRLRIMDGWISEVLNPLSGQRGPVVEIIPLLRPLKYRVALREGAVVRRRVELASNEVKRLPYGDIVEVSAKQFSDLGSRCVQRLKLRDGSGWLSMRLNKDPPEDIPIVDFVGSLDEGNTPGIPPTGSAAGRGRFPTRGSGSLGLRYDPGTGARNALRSSASTEQIVSDDEEHERERDDLRKIRGRDVDGDDTCVVCLSSLRTATIVHGEIGHIACCMECARILKGRGDPCPVCRIPIDNVVQHFWA